MLNSVPVSRSKPKPPPRRKKSRPPAPKRKRGGQPGNANARKHGLYAGHIPYPKANLLHHEMSKIRLSKLKNYGPGLVEDLGQTLHHNRRILSTLDALEQKAKTTSEFLVWVNLSTKIARYDLKIIKAIDRLEAPARNLFSLAQNAHYLVQWEFEFRGIPEIPLFVPLGFENFCAIPDASLERFRDNTIEVPSEAPLFVPLNLINFRANLANSTLPSPFLTDQQWLLVCDSLDSLRKDQDFFRKYKRRKPRFSTRLLFEAVLIKLAFNLGWDELPNFVYTYHPDLASFPLRECQRLYRDLFNSGRLQAIYKQLHWHLHVYGDTTLQDLVEQDCFVPGKKEISLAPGQSLTWQRFTALLLLQRAFHNQRARQREHDAERRRQGRYYRLPSPRQSQTGKSSKSSPSSKPIFSPPRLPELCTFEPLESSPAAQKWKAHEKLESLIQSRIHSSRAAKRPAAKRPAPESPDP